MIHKDRVFLKVSYAEKDCVKKLGAAWDPYSKGWWIPKSKDREPFTQWLPAMHNPNEKPPHLTCIFIPRTSWFDNARKYLIASEWNYLSKHILDSSGNRCEICGYRHPKYPLECHEDWDFTYDSKRHKHIQKLNKLMALCQPCHRAIHYSKSQYDKLGELALSQLMHVNGWDTKEAKAHIKEAKSVCEERSQHQWELDLSLLQEYGVDTAMILRQHKEREGFFGRGIDQEIVAIESKPQTKAPKKDWSNLFQHSRHIKIMLGAVFFIFYISLGRILD